MKLNDLLNQRFVPNTSTEAVETVLIENSISTPDNNFNGIQPQTFVPTIEMLGYSNEELQTEAFQKALQYNISMNPTTILDVGAGKGDFYRYIQTLGLPIQYRGIENNKILVDASEIELLHKQFVPEDAVGFDWVYFINTFNSDFIFNNDSEFVDEDLNSFILEVYNNVNFGISIVALNPLILPVEHTILDVHSLIHTLVDNNIPYLLEYSEYFVKILLKK